MLRLEAVNVGGGNCDAEYDVVVYLNERVLWKGHVKGHNRHHGWTGLLDDIITAYTNDPEAPPSRNYFPIDLG